VRVVIVTATPLDPIRGSGTGRGVTGLVQALERAGIDVRLIAPDRPAWWFTVERLLFNLQVPRRVAGFRPDLVIGVDMDGWLLARQARPFRYIAAPKGILADEARFEKGWTRFSMRLQAWFERRNTTWADRVVVPSQYARERLVMLYLLAPWKIAVIPECLDLASWRRLLEQVKRRRPRQFTVLTVCRFYPRKDLPTLLRAAREMPAAGFRIVGDGPCARRWRQLARDLGVSDRVTWLGNVSDDVLASEYVNCDLFCLPSRQEAFGIVFVEAMAAGKPVVAARAGAVPELVRDGLEGLLIPEQDWQGLAQALERLRENEALRACMGERGLERSRSFDLGPVSQLWKMELERVF